MEEATSNLASSGVLGSLVVVLVGVCIWLVRKLDAVQEARVEDAKKVATDSLAREEKWQTTLKELTDAVEKLLERSSVMSPRGGPR